MSHDSARSRWITGAGASAKPGDGTRRRAGDAAVPATLSGQRLARDDEVTRARAHLAARPAVRAGQPGRPGATTARPDADAGLAGQPARPDLAGTLAPLPGCGRP